MSEKYAIGYNVCETHRLMGERGIYGEDREQKR